MALVHVSFILFTMLLGKWSSQAAASNNKYEDWIKEINEKEMEKEHIKCSAFCHHNWLSYGSKCYRIIETGKDYLFSEFSCMDFGAVLASISSQEIYDFLTLEIQKYNQTTYWIGLDMFKSNPTWLDGISTAGQSWVSASIQSSEQLITCGIFDSSQKLVIPASRTHEHGAICEVNKILFNPIENCKYGLSQHSFIGEQTGKCIYRLPISSQSTSVQDKCAETGGEFLNIDAILRDGVNTFYEHKVLTNDGLKYWTSLTWNGSEVIWESRQTLEQDFPFISGSGSCITVAFNFTTLLETHLYQTECTAQAHIICAAARNTPTPTPVTVAPVQQQPYCPQGHNWKSSSVTGSCYWEASNVTNKMSWDDARAFCKGFGGDLASFHSIEDEKILRF